MDQNNNPISEADRDRWYKICAIMMARHGIRTILFTTDLAVEHQAAISVMCEDRDGTTHFNCILPVNKKDNQTEN